MKLENAAAFSDPRTTYRAIKPTDSCGEPDHFLEFRNIYAQPKKRAVLNIATQPLRRVRHYGTGKGECVIAQVWDMPKMRQHDELVNDEKSHERRTDARDGQQRHAPDL